MCLQHFKFVDILADRLTATHIVIGNIYDVNAYVLTWGGTLGFEHRTGVVGKPTAGLHINGKLFQIARAVEWIFFDVSLKNKFHCPFIKPKNDYKMACYIFVTLID